MLQKRIALFSSLLFVFTALDSFSQSNSFRLSGGVNAHTLLLKENTIAAIRPYPKSSFGISFARDWPSKLFFETGINFTTTHIYLEGSASDILPVNIDLSLINGNLEADIFTQFIEAPIVLGRRLYTGDKGHFIIRLGGYVGYLIAQQSDLVVPVVVSTPFFETTTNFSVSDETILADKRWDVGAVLGLGYGYDLSPNWRLGFNLRSQLSFVPITNDLVPNESGRYISAKGLFSVSYILPKEAE